MTDKQHCKPIQEPVAVILEQQQLFLLLELLQQCSDAQVKARGTKITGMRKGPGDTMKDDRMQQQQLFLVSLSSLLSVLGGREGNQYRGGGS